MRKKYIPRGDRYVVAIKIDIETDGLPYTKWGHPQLCKRGDWLVNNGGDIYHIDSDVFDATYRMIDEGRAVKVAPVWAFIADSDGEVKTLEGVSCYFKGDYIVSNCENGSDAYCVGTDKFHSLYELAT